PQSNVNRASHFQLSAMKYISFCVVFALGLVVTAAQTPSPQQPPAAQQPPDIATTINGASGAPPRLAVPAFLALSSDPEPVAAARTISYVLWNDLNYEHEFTFVSRDIYSTIPPATSIDNPPFDRWREVNADGLVLGSVQRSGNGLLIRYRLFDVT